MKKFLLFSVAMCMTVAAIAAGKAKEAGVKWAQPKGEPMFGSPKLDVADLKGKVVIVYYFVDSAKNSYELLPKVEKLYSSFKTRPFVLIGSECSMPKTVKGIKTKVSFPIYDSYDDPFKTKPENYPYFSVVDQNGASFFKGSKIEAATEALVNILSDMPFPGDMLPGIVSLKYHKAMKAQLMPGKNLETVLKTLKKESEVTKGSPSMLERASEAGAICDAVEKGKNLLEKLLESSDITPAEKYCYMDWMIKTFPSTKKTYEEDFKALQKDAAAVKEGRKLQQEKLKALK